MGMNELDIVTNLMLGFLSLHRFRSPDDLFV